MSPGFYGFVFFLLFLFSSFFKTNKFDHAWQRKLAEENPTTENEHKIKIASQKSIHITQMKDYSLEHSAVKENILSCFYRCHLKHFVNATIKFLITANRTYVGGLFTARKS